MSLKKAFVKWTSQGIAAALACLLAAPAGAGDATLYRDTWGVPHVYANTEAAGYCLIASAQREYPNLGEGGKVGGPRRLLSVVLKTASMEARANESQKLLNWGYLAFDTVRLFDAGKTVTTAQVWQGKAAQVALGTAGAVFVTVPKGEAGKLQTRIERADPLLAPLSRGQAVGTIKVVSAAGAPVIEAPLVALEAVEQAGVLGRFWDTMRLWIK